jgi:hypothetical protein
MNNENNTKEKEITRMDLLLEYRELPLHEIEFEHLDFDNLDFDTTYILRDGDEYWNVRYLNPASEIMAREDYVSCDPLPTAPKSSFNFVNALDSEAQGKYLNDKFKSILKSLF